MPIYDETYRGWQARGTPSRLRFWPITREGLRQVLVRRAFLALLILSWLPFLGGAVAILVITQIPDVSRVVHLDTEIFGTLLAIQTYLAILVSIFAGAGLIANDRGSGALLVYLSRPLTRRDYILGKLGSLLALNSAVTLAPGLALYAVSLLLAQDRFLRPDKWWLPPAIILQSLVISTVVAVVTLGVSALTRSGLLAGVGLAGMFVALEISRPVLRALSPARATQVISLPYDLKVLGSALFEGARNPGDPPLLLAIAVLAVVVAACLLVLRSKVRAVEVVA